MSTPSDVAAEVAAAMSAASRAVTDGTRRALVDAGNTARRNAPDVVLRNMRGGRIGAEVKVTDDEVTVTPTGPIGVLEPGARPHTIASKRPMRVKGGFRRGPFRHPGTPDTKAWTKAQEATLAQVERDLPETIGAAVERAFGGS